MFSQPSVFAIRNVGTISTSMGSIKVLRMAMKRARWPKYRYFERLYPARPARNTFSTVTESDTMKLLTK